MDAARTQLPLAGIRETSPFAGEVLAIVCGGDTVTFSDRSDRPSPAEECFTSLRLYAEEWREPA